MGIDGRVEAQGGACLEGEEVRLEEHKKEGRTGGGGKGIDGQRMQRWGFQREKQGLESMAHFILGGM